jgi:small GTP-binding protein
MPTSKIAKVFLAGEGGVGKTTMIERYIKGHWNPNTIMTIGVNHSVKIMEKLDLTLQIWDLGGEDRFRLILPSYLKGSFAGVLCFDTTRFSTFRNLPEWVKLIRDNVPDAPIILVGTKCDIDTAVVEKSVYQNFATQHDFADLFLTSSKTGKHIEDVFNRLADLINKIQPKKT